MTRPSRFFQWYARSINKGLPLLPSNGRYNLTVSHQPQFVWYRVGKVGSRTIFAELDKRGVTLDAEHPYDCYFPVRRFEDYFKFAFVRNPWDRFVSCWRNKVVKANHYGFDPDTHARFQDIGEFAKYCETLDLDRADGHRRRQSALIDVNNLDFLGRMETFEADLAKVLNALGFKDSDDDFRKKNVTKGAGNYRDFYDDESRDRVERLYRKDIDVFGYEF